METARPCCSLLLFSAVAQWASPRAHELVTSALPARASLLLPAADEEAIGTLDLAILQSLLVDLHRDALGGLLRR